MFDDARVTVSAPEGAFPEGTTVAIEEVTLGRTQSAAIENAVEAKVVSYKAYNITFNNAIAYFYCRYEVPSLVSLKRRNFNTTLKEVTSCNLHDVIQRSLDTIVNTTDQTRSKFYTHRLAC